MNYLLRMRFLQRGGKGQQEEGGPRGLQILIIILFFQLFVTHLISYTVYISEIFHNGFLRPKHGQKVKFTYGLCNTPRFCALSHVRGRERRF